MINKGGEEAKQFVRFLSHKILEIAIAERAKGKRVGFAQRVVFEVQTS